MPEASQGNSDDRPQRNGSCGCAICDLKIDFELDSHLIGELERQNCVIFAGSGISTETRHAHPNTLYDTLRAATCVEERIPFWELIDKFEAQPNGRQKLVSLIRDRFDHIAAFRDLKWEATRFHRALGNAPYFKAIITTNWDTYFEDVIAATPFVYDSDIPFWEEVRRPLIKVHGSIDNYSSLVASSEDYRRCEHRLREGPLGAVVKQIFATRTCIFCGYSARDPDFRNIFKTIRDGLGQFARSHYLVSPFVTNDEADDLRDNLGIISVRTDATHFVNVVKQHMVTRFCFTPDEAFGAIADTHSYFQDIHSAFIESYNVRREPHLIFATAYQDGVIHALERILDRALSGEMSDIHEIRHRARLYDNFIKSSVRGKNYWDAAYFSGYQNGLTQLLLVVDDEIDEIPQVPEAFHPGLGEMYIDEYNEIVRPNPSIHKAALKEALRRTKDMSDSDEMVVQHMPW